VLSELRVLEALFLWLGLPLIENIFHFSVTITNMFSTLVGNNLKISV